MTATITSLPVKTRDATPAYSPLGTSIASFLVDECGLTAAPDFPYLPPEVAEEISEAVEARMAVLR